MHQSYWERRLQLAFLMGKFLFSNQEGDYVKVRPKSSEVVSTEVRPINYNNWIIVRDNLYFSDYISCSICWFFQSMFSSDNKKLSSWIFSVNWKFESEFFFLQIFPILPLEKFRTVAKFSCCTSHTTGVLGCSDYFQFAHILKLKTHPTMYISVCTTGFN